MESHLRHDVPTAGVLVLQLNRPARRNALTKQLVIDIAAQLQAATATDAIRVVVLTGDDKAFCAGADIHEMNERGFDAILDEERLAAWRIIESFEKPLIAAVRGFAFGAGNELAMLCDLVIAGEGALFGQPETKIGGMAGDGGSQRLPRLVGRQLAAKMLLTGEPVGAHEALRIGLACEVVADAIAVERAVALAAAIATNAPLSVKATKALIRRTDEESLANGLRYEREALLKLFQSSDRVEGMRAFAEKRRPQWTGK